ncbi:MAG: O-antigen ligase family protein, partial [Oscillospiraceae bacterium]|nr:O-antigen ligase family protein [Oscillospiraceae bacterium]
CKELFFFCAACGILLYTVGERIFPDHPCRVNPLFTKQARFPGICIGVYFLLTVLSAICAKERSVVWQGNCADYEGIMSLTAYCTLFLFGYNYVSEQRGFRLFRRGLTVLAAVTAVLSVIEYTCVKLLELPFMQYLIAPAEYREMAASMKSRNSFREAVLMFYNSNYTGAFIVLIFPVTFYGLCTAKTLPKKLLAALLCAGVFAAGIMSNSTTAFYLTALELLVLTVYFAVKRVLPVSTVLVSVCVFAGTGFLLNIAAEGAFLATLRKNIANEGVYTESDTLFRLTDAELRGNALYVRSADAGYTILPPYESGEKLTAEADAGTECDIRSADDTRLVIHDAASGSDIVAEVTDGILYMEFGYDSTIDFAVTTNGLQLIAQNGQFYSEIPKAPYADSALAKYYGFATGRGYIWVNSLPILQKSILLGVGAGNFPFYFVQNDIVGMSNTNGTYHLVVDKAHSMYLQIAAASGIPALLAVLCLFAVFAFRGALLAVRTKHADLEADGSRIFLVCLTAGVCGYMVSGLVNDSCIAVSPVFWLCLGTAYCTADRLRKGAEKCGK